MTALYLSPKKENFCSKDGALVDPSNAACKNLASNRNSRNGDSNLLRERFPQRGVHVPATAITVLDDLGFVTE